jgi:hypothetical protein
MHVEKKKEEKKVNADGRMEKMFDNEIGERNSENTYTRLGIG